MNFHTLKPKKLNKFNLSILGSHRECWHAGCRWPLWPARQLWRGRCGRARTPQGPLWSGWVQTSCSDSARSHSHSPGTSWKCSLTLNTEEKTQEEGELLIDAYGTVKFWQSAPLEAFPLCSEYSKKNFLKSVRPTCIGVYH